MRSARAVIVIAMSLLLAAPALASETWGAHHERRVDRVVATPTPLGPFVIATASDETRWLVDVPAETTVFVHANGSATSVFYLAWHLEGKAPPDLRFPARAHAFTLPGPAQYIVRLDPAGGADFHARVYFDGFVTDEKGAPAGFRVVDAGNDAGCIVPGVCLP